MEAYLRERMKRRPKRRESAIHMTQGGAERYSKWGETELRMKESGYYHRKVIGSEGGWVKVL